MHGAEPGAAELFGLQKLGSLCEMLKEGEKSPGDHDHVEPPGAVVGSSHGCVTSSTRMETSTEPKMALREKVTSERESLTAKL